MISVGIANRSCWGINVRIKNANLPSNTTTFNHSKGESGRAKEQRRARESKEEIQRPSTRLPYISSFRSPRARLMTPSLQTSF